MSTAFERFIRKIHDYLKVQDCSIMRVGRISEVGTVVTFEVAVGDSKRHSSIIFEAKVSKGGIKVEPKKIVQITDLHRLYLWGYFINYLQASSAKSFTIKWDEYDTFQQNERDWVKRTIKLHELEKNEIQ